MKISSKTALKPIQTSKTKLLSTEVLLNRGMNQDECKAVCTSHEIPIREKLFFRIIYETQLRPFEVLNLQVENWDRKQQTVTALRTKQKWDNRNKDYLPSPPRTAVLTENTSEAPNRSRAAGHLMTIVFD